MLSICLPGTPFAPPAIIAIPTRHDGIEFIHNPPSY